MKLIDKWISLLEVNFLPCQEMQNWRRLFWMIRWKACIDEVKLEIPQLELIWLFEWSLPKSTVEKLILYFDQLGQLPAKWKGMELKMIRHLKLNNFYLLMRPHHRRFWIYQQQMQRAVQDKFSQSSKCWLSMMRWDVAMKSTESIRNDD